MIISFFSYCSTKHIQIKINSDFPGGNIIVDSVTQDTVYLRPDNRDSEKPWFYWYFEVSNTDKKQVIFKFNQQNVMTTFGPAVSLDAGETWNWLFSEPSDQDYFIFNFPEVKSEVRFCMAMPYLQTTLDVFCKKYHGQDRFKTGVLCTTKQGRKVEKINILPTQEDVRAKVLITARHHASEMMADYILEGIIDEIMNGKNIDFIKDHVEFMFIPFVDKDGVEKGDQGKHRKPRDHNRDYQNESIYASTAALRKVIPAWTDGLPIVALDLHNPWVKYDNNEITYMVGSSKPNIEEEQIMFSHLLDSLQKGLLRFNKQHFMPYGSEWNTNKNYEKGWSFDMWASQLQDILFSTTLETPYANNEGQQVTAESARSFGNDIVRALHVYLVKKQ